MAESEHMVSISGLYKVIRGQELSDRLEKHDLLRTERLTYLKKTILLPYQIPTIIPADEFLLPDSPIHSLDPSEDCILRLGSPTNGFEKLRTGRLSPREMIAWFKEQDIDRSQYTATLKTNLGHGYEWSLVFIVNKSGIFGELIRGRLVQLTHTICQEHTPISFSYDYNTWRFSHEDVPRSALEVLSDAVSRIKVEDKVKQDQIIEELDVQFYNNYLEGYFEITVPEGRGVTFNDHNILLGRLYANSDFHLNNSKSEELKGRMAYKGVTRGVARIVSLDNYANTEFNDGDILVAKCTYPSFVPLMQRAGAIVTEAGGILSHAAIIVREMQVPCVVGVENLLNQVKADEVIMVDADNGIITKNV